MHGLAIDVRLRYASDDLNLLNGQEYRYEGKRL